MSTTPPQVPIRRPTPWYFRPRFALWLGPLLITGCVALRFGWGGIAGPPGPFWALAYLLGVGGFIVTYAGWANRSRR